MSCNNYIQSIFSIDYYITKPNRKWDIYFSKFRGKLIYKVPIIRIFGQTNEGKKSCLHIHGVFPYMLIKCDSLINIEYAPSLAKELDNAINESFNNKHQTYQHIYDIKLIKCKSFYGFKENEETYLKIFFYNPTIIKRAVILLESHKIANKRIQPYEVHLPFILQFCIDYNLFGMNNIEITKVQFRSSGNNGNIDQLYKESSCEIECDTLSDKIVKCQNNFGPEELNPGLAAIWIDENNRRAKENKELLSYNDEVAKYSFYKPTKSQKEWKNKLIERLEGKKGSLTNINHSKIPISFESTFNVNLNNTYGPDQDSILGVDVTQMDNEENENINCSIEYFEEIDNESSLPFCHSLSNSLLFPLSNSTLNKSQFHSNFDLEKLETSHNSHVSKSLDKKNMSCQKYVHVEEDDNNILSGDPFLPEPVNKELPIETEKKFWFDPRYTDSDSVNSLFEDSEQNSSESTKEETTASILNERVTSNRKETKHQKIQTINTKQKASIKRKKTLTSSKHKEPQTLDRTCSLVLTPIQAKHVKELKLLISRRDIVTMDRNAKILALKIQEERTSPPTISNNITPQRKVLKNIPLLDGAWDSSPESSPKKYNKKKSSPKKVYKPLNITILTHHSPKKKRANTKVIPIPNNDPIAGPSKSFDSPIFQPKLKTPSDNLRRNMKEKLQNHIKDTPTKSETFNDIINKKQNNISTPLMKNIENSFPTTISPILNLEISSPLFLCQELSDQNEKITNANDDYIDKPSDINDLESLESTGIVSFYDDSLSVFNQSQFPTPSPIQLLHEYEPLIKAPFNKDLNQIDFSIADKQPFYGKSSDITGPLIYRGRTYELKLKDQMTKNNQTNAIEAYRKFKFNEIPLLSKDNIWIEPLFKAPLKDHLNLSIINKLDNTKKNTQPLHNTNESLYEIQGATLDNTYGFRLSISQNSENNGNNLIRFGLEVHCKTRGSLNPDPKYDQLRALFYSVDERNGCLTTGLIYINVPGFSLPWNKERLKIECVDNERVLIGTLINYVQKYDPDLLIGYEVECMSWGYFCERAKYLDLFDVEILLSRIPNEKRNWKESETSEEPMLQWSKYHLDSAIPGRVILNVWRILRHEVALSSYSFENMYYHIIHHRAPHYTNRQLTLMWEDSRRRITPIEYYLTRIEGTFTMLERLDILSTTSELARVFGIQFYQVLARGSQFRVESMMFRSAKPFDYVFVSPNPDQREKMRESEIIPYILDPYPRMHTEPVIVLDFQSLYPSIMIAYNYCYSTCLGRVEFLGSNENFEFGCVDHNVSPDFLRTNMENLNFSPVGVTFVNQNIRVGILPKMLSQILSTRIMVKNALKENKNNKHLKRTLHARQLGLKLIANVTYGYTSANFSGRMPCVEIGDSIVSKARETLERAIELVNNNTQWRAKVVYGDTDSLFVSCPGRTVKQAYDIGREIADAVTHDNPKPIVLKLEKVYQPLILQTMKKYVGYSYENPEQEKPMFDSKGIETVRRDGCPIASKILEKALHILFDTLDVSQVKSYVQYQLKKILSGRSNMQDFIFAKEFRGLQGYSRNASVPALELARRFYAIDPRSVPRSGDRVPYVIVHGQPGALLVNLVRSPNELLNPDAGYRINLPYYFSKHILPPLERSLALIGADVNNWFFELPKPNMASVGVPKNIVKAYNKERHPRGTLSQFFINMNCIICGMKIDQQINTSFCFNCLRNPQTTTFNIVEEARKSQRRLDHIYKICDTCCGIEGRNHCDSWDCPILFRKNLTLCEVKNATYIESLIKDTF